MVYIKQRWSASFQSIPPSLIIEESYLQTFLHTLDTDIVSGIESGLDTVLVLSGVSTRKTVETFPYRPRLILNHVGEIPTESNKE
ncbi:MAG TPA: HAD hydrolase-like protein [Candidatus Anaerotignum merdipullorum]|nr:HAD hydrolase-like protein [Candidatus Anaerotignum merdipullorum]